MARMTLSDISEKMRDIDFTMLFTHAADGRLAGRPMSNNRDVDYEGDSWFFALESTSAVQEISADPNVALSFAGSKGLLGKPPIFIAVQGRGELIRDKARFAEHWDKDLERWFEQGVDTPGLVLIKVHASLIHYWDGEDEGEIPV
ncbi:pyridoxamine 5'-phosphate oxidase family protein [Caulobacter sp. 73W]|uniref:Pyridoxamine 5'-phosphate oxidase family protein n=1 Tax=Caulobacter sp. 73W TaxID=3161137 RepID=A0AB39KXY6_9CAUL